MINNKLAADERGSLIKRHRVERDGRVRDRMKAVLLTDDGWTTERIAAALFIDEQTVRQHVSDYVQTQKLKPENGGSTTKLNVEQTTELIAHIDSKVYATIKEICAYVEAKYQIKYSVRGMTDWLKRQDFTFHQPCGVPAKADAASQQAFIDQYQKLQKTCPMAIILCLLMACTPATRCALSAGGFAKVSGWKSPPMPAKNA
jgi:transposase